MNGAGFITFGMLMMDNMKSNNEKWKKAKVYTGWKLPAPNYAPNGSDVIIDNEGLPKNERVKQLKVAGALIAAEIDRILAK